MPSQANPNQPNSFDISSDGSNSPSRPQNKKEALADLEKRFAPKGLLEIALLKCEPPQKNLEEAFAALDKWMKPIIEEDQELGIGRVAIPHAPIWIPQTPEGIKFFNIANSVAKIAKPKVITFKTSFREVLWDESSKSLLYKNADNLPSLEDLNAEKQILFNQACFLKTLQYYWQAKGVAFAYKYLTTSGYNLDFIRDPVGSDGILTNRLPTSSLTNLKSDVKIHLAFYNLISLGEELIRDWAKEQLIEYKFKSPLELFRRILQAEFEMYWEQGPLNWEHQSFNKRSQQYRISNYISLLADNSWSDHPSKGKKRNTFNNNSEDNLRPAAGKRKATLDLRNSSFEDEKSQFVEYLRESGWSGYWILALQPYIYRPDVPLLAKAWKAYIHTLRSGKQIFFQDLDWRYGEPYKCKLKSDVQPVKAFISNQGYINWCWA